MSNLFETIVKGGPTMIPMVGLSIATIACGLERSWFWFQLMRQEERIVHDVMEAARLDLSKAAEIASQAQELAIGRFLLAPLKLKQPTPETFQLALEAAADREFIQMRKGDKLLESVVGIAPLLGLLGTVTGLIATFASLKIGGGGTSADTTKAAAGIGEALITTAAGMIVAIISLAIFRVMVTLQSRQIDYFSRVGSDLELIYREIWYEPAFHHATQPNHGDYSTASNVRSLDS
ncbi:MAG: MotA/TolQ/ExbB proton channel family protein [Phormidesmis sp. CAN_BIN44]|nr:MotA/TolQ/ExbB proton channel family protein [Phormidesmis sp. CAN_BIN44]